MVDNTTILVESDGDIEAGIRPLSTTVDLKVNIDDNDEMREFVREQLSVFFGEVWQQSVTVRYEDELSFHNTNNQ